MIRPRRIAHRGPVVATGFVIDPALVGTAEARRRVLASWVPGAVVRESEGAFVITGLPARRVRVARAPGTPLVEQHGVLAAMPLDADEAADIGAPGCIVIASAGAAQPLDAAREVDLAAWIDLGQLQVADVKPLAAPPASVALPPPPATDIRIVTGAPAADRRVNDVSAALMRSKSKSSGSGAPSPWNRLMHWLSTRLQPRQKALPAGPGSQTPQLSWLDRVRSRIALALWRSRLGGTLGRRHAAYLRRLVEMFDRGQLEEALRHAIPLGGEGGDGRLSLGVPRPRESLALTLGARAKASIIPVADVAMAMMRERYRAAAARLEQTGRIDEAAFVLAELLSDPTAAIALLERHKRYAVAAQLAEARRLEPGLIVRLWFLAGDRQRAIDLARAHRAWADAVARLEKAGDSRASILRMMWADHLADTGDFVQAVETAWPVESSRGLIEAWIDRGIALEGSAAARLLVKKLVIAPSSFPKIAPAVLEILARVSDADATRQRLAVAVELINSPPSAELQTLARPAARALLRDSSTAVDSKPQLIEHLIRFADDAALRADRPAIPAAAGGPTLLERFDVVDLQWSGHDAGAIPVYDAAPLPGDRLLLALGERGVRIIGRKGQTLAHIDQPATRLVMSDHGSRALAIIGRGQVQRLARIDLSERRGAHWCDAELDDGADTFDGDLWIATRGSEVFAVDTTASRWRAVWGVSVDKPDARCSVRRDGGSFVVDVQSPDELAHWHYEGFTLRSRKPWNRNGTEYVVVAPKTTSKPFVVRDPEDATVSDVATITSAARFGDLVVLNRSTRAGVALECKHLKAYRAFATLRLDGANHASMRLDHSVLTVGDDRGRVIIYDIERGVVRRELRTR